MEFYKIWRGYGGTIGVNKLSLFDMVKVQGITVLVFVILIALISVALPTIIFGCYVLWMMMMNGYEGSTKERLTLNIITVLSVIYYLIDFHFGFVSFHILGGVISKETLNDVAIFNVSVGIVSIACFFIGHEMFKGFVNNHFIRVLLFGVMIFFAFKIVKPVSTYIVTNVVTQCDREFNIGVRSDGYIAPMSDDEREQKVLERKRKEAEKDAQMKQYDIDYSNGKR